MRLADLHYNYILHQSALQGWQEALRTSGLSIAMYRSHPQYKNTHSTAKAKSAGSSLPPHNEKAGWEQLQTTLTENHLSPAGPAILLYCNTGLQYSCVKSTDASILRSKCSFSTSWSMTANSTRSRSIFPRSSIFHHSYPFYHIYPEKGSAPAGLFRQTEGMYHYGTYPSLVATVFVSQNLLYGQLPHGLTFLFHRHSPRLRRLTMRKEGAMQMHRLLSLLE